MARFIVKASEFKNVCKAVNDRKLAELKKEIIEILKKQDVREFNKAIDWLCDQEHYYTHLEKSVTGKWVEKAGYGIGTVRTWKGKKYKKIAPGKWVRVFDKEGRGTSIAIGKLIAKVQKIDNVEDLMALVMANKQRFVDANGVDLPILDKLRAAVDAKNNGTMRSKLPDPKDDNSVAEYKKQIKDKVKEYNMNYEKYLENQIAGAERHNVTENELKALKELQAELKGTSKPAEKEDKIASYKKQLEDAVKKELVDQKEDVARLYEIKDRGASGKHAIGLDLTEKDKNTSIEDRIQEAAEWLEKNPDGKAETIGRMLARVELAKEFEKNPDWRFGKKEKPAEKGDLHYSAKAEDHERNELVHKIRSYSKDIDTYEAKRAELERDGEKLARKDNLSKEEEKKLLQISKNRNTILQMIKERNAEVMEAKQKLAEYDERKRRAEAEAEAEKTNDSGFDEESYKKSKKKLEATIADIDKKIQLYDSNPTPNGLRMAQQLENQKKEWQKQLDQLESEAEKHQNRSEAMKGNQNAKKYGLTDDQIEYYDIQEVVEDVNGYGIVKNSEGKYSYIDDGSVKDRPEDFEETIEKVKDRIEGAYQTKLNVEAAKNYDFANADFGPDIKYQKKSNGKHEYYKKDGDKALSVTVEISNMREPLNMTYEVTDVKTGESWEYDASYGNKEGLDWASERPEQMEEEIKKFFKRNPVKEWDKMTKDIDPDAVNIEPVKSVTDKKTPIGKSTKISDGKASIKVTNEAKEEVKQLISCLSKDKTDSRREFLRHVYYDGENIVGTDGIHLKVIKVGEIDGIEPNKYISIDTKGKDNIVIEQDNQDYGHYVNYKRVIPENNKQQIRFNNNVLKEKINEMKKDGSIDMESKRISLKVQDGNVYLDNVRVGSADGVKFEDDRKFIDFNYTLLTNALSGNESIMAVSDNPERSVSISTNVSDNIFMPLKSTGEEEDYEKNRREKSESDAALEQKRAQDAADKEDSQKRSITDEAKADILKNKPEGVTDRDYEDLIDYCNDFYAKLGYDNSTERGKRDIKRTIDNAIKGIYDKDYEILDMIENPDNKVSRKVFETITALRLGSNRESAKKAWESWVGKEGVKAHKDKIAAAEKAEKDRVAAEKKAAEDAEREQYHGFMDGKTPAGKGRAREILAKRGRFGNDVYTYQELADHYINELGGHASENTYLTSGGKEKKYYMIADANGRGYEVPKIVYDYAAHIQNGGVKKSIIDVIMMNDYEHDILDDFEEENEEEYNDYSAEQPELFNSTEFMVEEAFNRHCDCM